MSETIIIGGSDSGLAPNEERKVEKVTAENPTTAYEAVFREGEDEVARPATALAYSAFAAGLAMGLSFLAEGVLRHHLPDAEWRPLLTKLGYPVGFLIVIIGHQQLFTENTLTPIIPMLDKRSHVNLGAVLRLWAIVLLGNLIGATVIALTLARTTAVDAGVHHALHDLAVDAFQHGAAATILLKSVFAGWLIALVAWLIKTANTEQVLVISILTYLIGIGTFPHIIAGTVAVMYGVWDGSLSFSTVATSWMLPTLIGNILGGVILTGALNYAQVAAGQVDR